MSEGRISRRRPCPSLKKLAMLVVVAGALAAPAPAGAKLLVASYNEGLEPHAELQGHTRAIKQPKQLRVQISGVVQEEVHGRFTIKCYRHGTPMFSRNYTLSGISPAERVVQIRARWEQCLVTRASARFADPFLQGWIQILAWGTPR